MRVTSCICSATLSWSEMEKEVWHFTHHYFHSVTVFLNRSQAGLIEPVDLSTVCFIDWHLVWNGKPLNLTLGSFFPGFSLAECQMRNQDLISQEAPIVRFSGLTFHANYVNLWNILLTDLPAWSSLLDTC